MKRHLNPPKVFAALAAVPLLLGAFAGQVSAQTNLIEWTHSWNYMHPNTGTLPAGSGATEPNSGATKWYVDKATFDASYAGPSFTTAGAGFDAGLGAAPIGYGAMDYFTVGGAEFAALGTTLTTPADGSRRTGYFRTTFTVPNDGNLYTNPSLRNIFDDGGFVYLDGELVLVVNMPVGAVDDFNTNAATANNVEGAIRTANLSLPVGSTTNSNTTVAAYNAPNAVVVKRLLSLTPGEHTLAISVHNSGQASTDLGIAIQLQATPTNCSISGAFTNITRNAGALAGDPSDDTVSVKVNVTPTGTVSPAGWKVTAPASIANITGAYSTDVNLNIPISEFPADPTATPTNPSPPVTITLADAATAVCTTSGTIPIPRVIATDNRANLNLPIMTELPNPSSGWVFDDTARTMLMNNGGAGVRKVVKSTVIDLTTTPAIQFTGNLLVHDTTTGMEAEDSFVAYLIIDGNTANPITINLITAYDTIVADGVLVDDELATGAGDFVKDFNYTIPSAANSVQIVIEGINNSANEFYTVRDMKFSAAAAGLGATVGPVTLNNQGTDTETDDTFGAPVTIEAVNLPGSTGWTSDTIPASGLYADPQPVVFQGYSVIGGQKIFILTDTTNLAMTKSVTLTPPTATLTVTGPTNVTRVENGPGAADDTLTFNATITGSNGGPRWSVLTPGVTPTTGAFGPVTFTITAPLPTTSPFMITIGDISYPGAAQTIGVGIPGTYVMGQSNVTGTLLDVRSSFTLPPPAEFINDPILRTLEVNNGGTPEKVLESDTINLSGVGAVQFTAKFRATDNSATSNLDTDDKVKAELVYEVGGVPATINLFSTWDTGNGAPSAGNNGPADGYLNGFSGTTEADYDANRARDEFNKNSQAAAETMDATFDLAATIPADADNVKLKLYVLNVGTTPTPTERVFFTDILFSTGGVPVDTDNDGMTDAYEDANGLDKNDPADKLTDLDGDGQSNYAEFLAGTGANNPASTLRITTIVPTATPNTYDVSIATVAGKRYQLEESTDNGIADTWAPVAGSLFTATGPVTTVPVPIGGLGVRHFLRAKVVP